MANIYDRDIDKHVDWNGDETTSGRPVSGRAVQKFIKDTLQAKIGYIYNDTENNVYLGFADEEDYNLYIEDPITYENLIIASWEAPADLYGPYESVAAACQAIPISRRSRGLTVGIVTLDTILEYQWKSGITDNELVKKAEQLLLDLHLVGSNSFTKEEGESIFGRFMVEGGIGVKKAVLYQLVNGNEVFVQEYDNIGKGSAYQFSIPNPSVSGIYTYRIKVLDSLDNYAITETNANYLEYTLHYGGISTVYNLTELNAINVKNYSTVANVPFQLNIAIRDNTFSVSDVYLTDSTDEFSENLRIELIPSTGEYIGNNTYYMPNEESLLQFNGKRCSIVVTYMDGENARSSTKELFRLLDIANLDILPEYEGMDYYESIPGYYTFQLQAGVENISIVLTPEENSDFNFERSTVLAYRRFPLRVIPKAEKNNAQIVIRYHYTYNNTEYSDVLTRTIGNILTIPPQSFYEPDDGSTIARADLVYADIEDHTGTEDGRYYKVISEPLTEQYRTSSFILDTYCKINQQNDKTINYINVKYGNVDIINVTEDEISTQWGNLYTDTPINEWAQIGIGVNLEESIKRGDQTVTGYYHCIYINGMVVKSVLIDESSIRHLEYNSNEMLTITIGENIVIQKCFLYYKTDGSINIFPNTKQDESIIYNNYKNHKFDFEEPSELPVLKFLRISNPIEMERYFGLINAHKDDKIKHLTTFGTIGLQKARDINEYDANYASDVIESNATLFRQSVDIKKPAQKEYAVLCKAMWMGREIENVVVEVHTQGTSTLVYSIPNFKFTFWRIKENDVEEYYPEFIQKDNSEEYYQECVYTAKADFMDSSHLNNTPTCNYYNSLIQNLRRLNKIEGSPAARNDKLDAIMGFPIVLEISDNANNFDDIFINIGSFMLNIDKTGDSLGFEVEEDGNLLKCISFEGTSNDNEHGAAGRFDIPEGIVLKNYLNGTGELNINEITEDYNIANSAKNMRLDDIVNGTLVSELPYVKWCNFLSDGLEYRYPDSDIYKESNGTLKKIMKKDDFIKLYKMWSWVNNSENLNQNDYKAQFVQHFDLNYCMIYFINLMIYAQTDNLGKNAMFDCWDGEHWYPRPYDLDSETGLDNNGNDNIAPFVEIKPVFSLNYNPTKANDYDWLNENYLIDDEISAQIKDETGLDYPASTILYGAKSYDRYHFSSNKSKLWISFYKNFKTDIEAFYGDLRRNCGYTPETIINLCQSVLIDKLGTAQYNQDFKNKYLGNNDQKLAYGNRWYKFKKWITKRFAFCDSYFGAFESAAYNLNKTITYNIKVDAPQYIVQQYQSSSDIRFVLDNASFNAGSGAATIITLKVNQPSVFETSLFKSVVFNGGSKNYKNLISLDVSGNSNDSFTSITSVTGDDLNNLKYLNISNSKVQNLIVPPNVKTLLAENVNLSLLTIPEGCAIEEISLKGSTLIGNINFSNLPNLKRLDLTDCTFNGNVTFSDLPQLDELIIVRTVFRNGTIIISNNVKVSSFDFSNLTLNEISFNGSDIPITSVNFHNTTFGVPTLNLNAIKKYVQNLDFTNCKGLTHLEINDGGAFENLQYLSLTESSVKALGNNSNTFDCSHFTNMSSLRKITYDSNNVVSTSQFTFQSTKIEQIVNINWNGTGANLFRDCQNLVSVDGIFNFTKSISYLFWRCYALTTIPTSNITITSDDLDPNNFNVTDASYAFSGTNLLSYNNIKEIIKKCRKVNNFTGILRCKQFNTNESINLNELFVNNTASNLILASFFSQYVASSYKNINNNIVITGKLPISAKDTQWMFYGFKGISIPYDILSGINNLTTANTMFAASTVTFTGNDLPFVNLNGTVVTLTNSVDKTFFNNTNLTTVAQMFYNSNIITTDTELFRNLPALMSTSATFASTSVKRFSVTRNNVTTSLDLDVSNMWVNNSAITNISGCFSNIYNVYCNSLNFHNNITSSKTINISGLFGLANSTYRSTCPITINIDAIVPKITTDIAVPAPTNSGATVPGVFQNRSVSILRASSETTALGKLSSNSRNMFYNAVIYLPDNITTLDLDKVIHCQNMFRGARLYKSLGSEHQYTINDRKFVNVRMPSNCSNYSYMFRDSSILDSLPAIRSSSASDLSYMYYGCVINLNDLELPYNYFETCADKLTNVSYMFGNNKYLTTLGYNNARGLFEGCVNLTNVSHMFDSAYFLHKGIPVNFFGSTNLPRLTSLEYMFASTSIIFDVEDNSYKWINSDTIAPLVNLNNISHMFYRTKINGGYNNYSNTHGVENFTVSNFGQNVPIIDPYTFYSNDRTIDDITSLFEHSKFKIDPIYGGIRFKGFLIGTNAFFNTYMTIIGDPFVDTNYLPSIKNVDRMFYQSYTGGRYNDSNKTIDNLAEFINELVGYPNILKNNIAGHIEDDAIPDTYKAASNIGDGNVTWGIELTSTTAESAESTWTNYGRYFYGS